MTTLDHTEQDPWVQRLSVDAPQRDAAIAELRRYLTRGLNCSLKHRYGGLAQVDDIVQLALLKIIESIGGFKSRCRFTTWAMAIATRVGISELRRRCYRDVSLNLSAAEDEFQVEAVDPLGSAEDQVCRQNLLVLLQRLIVETLSEKQRLAIRGSLAGLPVEEIAIRLQSNRNAIYKLIHDARLKLRQGFEASGVTVEDIANII